MNHKFKDLTGKRYGRLTVVELFGTDRWGKAVWKCQCDCGKVKTVVGTSLTYGNTKSCGCYCRELAIQNPVRNIKPKGYASKTCVYNNYKQNARKKSISFELSRSEFENLTSQACHYCGTPPSQIITGKELNGSCLYNGIDRVNSSKGYTLDNCVPCCKYCNFAKNNRSKEDFISWVNKIYHYNKIQELNIEETNNFSGHQ